MIQVGFKAILMGLFGAKSGRDGLWDFLAKRSADKRRVELERERNEGTQRAILLLKPGMVLREGGPGWSREIIAQGVEPSVLFTAVASPLPVTPATAAVSSPEPPQIASGPQDPGSAGDPINE